MEPKKTNSIFNSDMGLGVVCFLLGLWWLTMSMQMPSSTAKDGTPGPAAFPIGIALLVMAVSVVIMVLAAKTKVTYFDIKAISKENGLALLISLVLFVVFLVLWNLIHYIVASFALSLGLALVYKIKPVSAAILAVVYSAATYFIFTEVLKVMLNLV